MRAEVIVVALGLLLCAGTALAQESETTTEQVNNPAKPPKKEFLWGDSFWGDGYFAETVGKVDEEVIRKYIERQGKIK